MEPRYRCPKSSTHYINLRKAYDKFKNVSENTNDENLLIYKYSECVIKNYFKRNLTVQNLENICIKCCKGIRNSECLKKWVKNTYSCLIKKINDIDGSNDEAYIRREIDENYQLTTRLKDSLAEKKQELGLLSTSYEQEESDTKWLPCLRDSVYFNSILESFFTYDNQIKEYEKTNFDIFSQCFIKYIIEKGPEINSELEHALYKCCNGIESIDCQEDWAINILSCWIQHRFFTFASYYDEAALKYKRKTEETVEIQDLKLEPVKKKMSWKKRFDLTSGKK